MGKLKSSFLAAACLAAGALAAPASAATVIKSYEFTAVTGGPITNHSGSFTYSYDDADPTNLTLLSIDFALGGYVFDLSNTGIRSFIGGWQLGGTSCDIGCINSNTNDFWLIQAGFGGDFSYSVVGFNGFGSAVPTITAVTPGVPEPSTWAMLLLGFFAAGAALRSGHRRHKVTVSYA